MIVKFDPGYPLMYGYYQCDACGREWYDDHPFHMPGCRAEPTYTFGPKEMIDFTPVELRDQVSQILSKGVIAKST